ncbi:hypothetical protein BX600DRAFT_429364 [Xylariales sp. PMI_506]|nr:hypothetical protein BX600DRAFT_429364 [Xylariales sp. PMI_506]
MESLPVELLRLIFAYCDRPSARSLREVSTTFAEVGYEYILSPEFTVLGYRNDLDRLHNIALHPQLRGGIQSLVINLSDVDDYDANHAAWSQNFLRLPEERQVNLNRAWGEFRKITESRKMLNEFQSRGDDLTEAFSGLSSLGSIAITFTQCPVDNKVLRDVYGVPSCRRMDRELACNNLNVIIAALHGISLSSFSVDRFPLELYKVPNHRRHWFTHAKSFSSLTRLHLTLDPSGLQGPASAVKAINGLGYILQLPKQLRDLKLAFHPYQTPDSKFAVSFRELLNGFSYPELVDLSLEGISCEEEDLKQFLVQHSSTLRRLRLGGRGLAKPYQVSLGGMHLYEGTFRSLFTGLRTKLPKLERLHLEGIFECEHYGLPSHETYNFYPLSNEQWEEVPRPSWVRAKRDIINCLKFEEFLLFGGTYPGSSLGQQQHH